MPQVKNRNSSFDILAGSLRSSIPLPLFLYANIYDKKAIAN